MLWMYRVSRKSPAILWEVIWEKEEGKKPYKHRSGNNRFQYFMLKKL